MITGKWLARRFDRRSATARSLTRRATIARQGGDWGKVADLLGAAILVQPDDPRILVQYGHALKEIGDAAAAIGAYEKAADLVPDDVDVRVHLASLLRRQGELPAAQARYEQIVRLNSDHLDAARALQELGARDALGPRALSRTMTNRGMLAISDRFDAWQSETLEWLQANASAPAAYDLFRARYPTPPPPATEVRPPIDVVIEAAGASAAFLRVTLDSLADQSHPVGRVIVRAGGTLREHAVASVTPLALEWDTEFGNSDRWMIVAAGAILDVQATAWLLYAQQRTGADAVYADHDQINRSWPGKPVYSSPFFWGPFDRDALACAASTPPVVLVGEALLHQVDRASDMSPEKRIRSLLIASLRGVHVPRRLASLWRLSDRAKDAPLAPTAMPPRPAALEEASSTALHVTPFSTSVRLAVILPTRNNADLAVAMVRSLRSLASDPGSLDILVCDNGSEPHQAARLRAALAHENTDVADMAGAFNWSALNNHAVQASSAPLLLFVNDDMVMRSQDWDLILRSQLARPEIGVVGAQLLYPDDRYQHAGILFGLSPGCLSVHEGAGIASSLPGPHDRWHQSHSVSAVTGAFLATRRTVFEEVGGFDERLAVAYNDIDFCFATRTLGLHILYEPRIRATHFESVSRGLNRTDQQLSWDDTELSILHDRWGVALAFDPGYNPQWATHGTAFDGYREPPVSEIERHLTVEPWRLPPAVRRKSSKPSSRRQSIDLRSE